MTRKLGKISECKKSSGPALSYDELIESKKQMFSNSEFALENWFEEDLDYEP